MGLIIADTNIVVYSIKGLPELKPYILTYNFAVSEITVIELLGIKGIDPFTLKRRKEFLEDCHLYHYNSYIRVIAIRLKQKYVLRIPDALIAATAIHYDIPFLTADKDFKKIEELEVIIIEL
jgi:hypothetical protein